MAKDKPFHHRNLKEALHDAALSLLDAGGISAVTIRAVAREVGVSHAAPVNHYKDRQSLLTAIAVQQFQTILADVEERLGISGLSTAERIEAIPSAMLDYGLKHPNRYQLLWRRDLIDYADPHIVDITDQIYDWLCDEIQQGIPESTFDRDTVAIALWSMVHGYVDMRQNGMFLEKTDAVNGQPRQRAMLDVFRAVLGAN
ncbi:MAG: TetR/AcrR family transcriptional regulator [Gammaproteobacteria bacterium]|jgi:AcrR family transcriptional regulator|nr:TetR/AcrR family transcriptional regulator [Gammaproteobacteria bacterium]